MEESAHNETAKPSAKKMIQDSLLHRKYVIPFILACVILFCNTATGVNSIIGYNAGILLQSGLSDLQAHWGYVLFTTVNFFMTMVGMMLVDRTGRRFLLIMGTTGIIVSLVGVGILFLRTERFGVDTRDAVQALVTPNQELTLHFDRMEADRLLSAKIPADAAYTQIDSSRASLAVIYSYGDFTAATSFVRSDDLAAAPIQIARANCVPANKVEAFFKNPFADLGTAPHCTAQDSEGPHRQRTGPEARLASGSRVISLHGLLRGRPRRMRMACFVRADANSNPVQRNEHCAGDQPACFHYAGRHFSALRQQVRLLLNVLPVLPASP